MNVAQMLKMRPQSLDQLADRQRRLSGSHREATLNNLALGSAKMAAKAEARYREAFRGEVIHTQQLADRLGAGLSSNVIRTLRKMKACGLVEELGPNPSDLENRPPGRRGRMPIYWRWIGI